jgi:hypothetical protein
MPAQPLDLGVDLRLVPLQILDTAFGIGLGVVHDLAQQRKHAQQPRFGAHDLALLQALYPLHRLRGGRGQVEFRLIAQLRIVLAQVGCLAAGPVLQVLAGAAWISHLAVDLPQRAEVVLQQ